MQKDKIINKAKSNYDNRCSIITLTQKGKTIYKEIDGWQSSTLGINKWSDLPEKAKFYINEIENIVEKDISIISTGPERSQTIDKKNILKSD